MRTNLLWVLVIFLGAMFAPSVARADTVDQVVTTDRLNLRACPSTSGCRVLRTLPVDTSLTVTDRRGEWLQVKVLEDGGEGWVHSDYTRATIPAPSIPASRMLSWDFLPTLFVVGSILGALVLTGYAGPKINPSITGRQIVTLSVVSVMLGGAIILNQFGPILQDLTSNYLDLERLSPFWEINTLVDGWIKYSHVILLLLLLAVGIAAAAPAANECRASFLQGALTGFFALPALVLTVGIVGVIAYLLYWIFKAVGWVVGVILIPVAWILEHVVLPILRFLSIPLVWLWENGLRDLVEFLGTPFVWLWSNVLHPALNLVFRFIVKPILLVALGIVTALLALFPFGVVGVVAIESMRSAVRTPMSPVGLFSHGIAIGFLLFDAALLAVLAGFDLIQTIPPLSLLIPLAPQLIVFARLLAPTKSMEGGECPVFRDKLLFYWRTSRLHLLSTCVVVPVGVLLMRLYSEDS